MSELGKKLKSARIEKGLSTKKLSEITGVSESTLKSWEEGVRNPKIESIQPVLDALHHTSFTNEQLIALGHLYHVLHGKNENIPNQDIFTPVMGVTRLIALNKNNDPNIEQLISETLDLIGSDQVTTKITQAQMAIWYIGYYK